MKKLMFYGLSVAVLMATTSTPVFARELGDYLSKERFQLRARVLGIVPDDDSTVNIGGDADVGNAVTPEVDVTYFITPNIAAELIAATAQHSITYTGD